MIQRATFCTIFEKKYMYRRYVLCATFKITQSLVQTENPIVINHYMTYSQNHTYCSVCLEEKWTYSFTSQEKVNCSPNLKRKNKYGLGKISGPNFF